MYQPNDRISVGGDLGTVRYIGPVPNWDVDALGIEWDNPARGKHSGCLKGVHYFNVSCPGSGSFVKVNSPRIDQPVSFIQALRNRYAIASNATIEEVSIGSKTWQNYGLQKLNAISDKYQDLPSLMVEKSCIDRAGQMESLRAASLDLSYNLFSRWEEVQKILDCMPELQSVNLNGNRILDYSQAEFRTARSVYLSDTGISPNDLAQAQLPHVESLVLAGNNYTQFDTTIPKTLKVLDLSFNHLNSVPCVDLQELNVSHNAISQLSTKNDYLQSLDLRWNPISSFSEIDKIPQLFPNLTDLKIDHLDFCHGDDLFLNIVCRVPGLVRLNGSDLSDTEVRSYELFFVSKVQRNELSISNQHTWKQLLAKHKIKEKLSTEESVPEKLLSPINLELAYESSLFKRAFLGSNTIFKLKGVVSVRMKLPVWQVRLYYYLDNEEGFGKQYLENDMLTLETCGLENNQRVFVELSS